MNRLLVALALAAAICLPRPASAEGAAKKLKVAVLDVKAAGTIDPKTFEGIASLLSAELGERRKDVVVIGAADIRAMIGFEREKSILGCTEGACLAEIGGALGVDYLLVTEGSRLGGTWIVTMSLIEVAKSKAVKRVARRTDTENKLVDLCVESVREVAMGIPGGVAEPAIEAKPVKVEHPVATTSKSGHAVSPAVSYVLIGIGVALAGGGGGCLGGAWGIRSDLDTNTGNGNLTKQQAQDKASTGGTLSKVGVAGISVGAAVLAAGVITLLIPGSADAPQATVVPLKDGAYASVTFPIP